MLKVAGLSKIFGGPHGSSRVVDDVSFVIPQGECYALLGPSGCGKTTTLRCVAGLEVADAGTISIGDTIVSDVAAGIALPVHERPIGMVFQSYAIWPHMSVFDNVAYPLTVGRPRPSKSDTAARTMEALALVGMDGAAKRSATQLSGGQQQRVALARAIVRRPKLLLLDEPLSNLDARLRDSMRHELSEMIARVGVTALFVTHDQAEAFALAHRIAVMNQGRIVQEGAPREIYAYPHTTFAATFLGAANILPGDVLSSIADGHVLVAVAGTPHRLRVATAACKPGDRVDLVIRPEDIALAATAPANAANVLAGQVTRVTFLGGHLQCEVAIGAALPVRVVTPRWLSTAAGDRVWLSVAADRCAALASSRP